MLFKVEFKYMFDMSGNCSLFLNGVSPTRKLSPDLLMCPEIITTWLWFLILSTTVILFDFKTCLRLYRFFGEQFEGVTFVGHTMIFSLAYEIVCPRTAALFKLVLILFGGKQKYKTGGLFLFNFCFQKGLIPGEPLCFLGESQSHNHRSYP